MRNVVDGNFVEKKMNGQKSEEPVMADALLARAQNREFGSLIQK